MVKRDLVSCPGRQANPMSLRGSNNVKTHWLQTFCCFVLLVVVLAPRAVVAQDSTGTTSRVSVSSVGEGGNGRSRSPSLSADGRFVAFASKASNLVAGDTNHSGDDDIFVHDRQTGTTTRVSVSSAGQQGNGGSGAPSLSADGRFVAFDSYASNLVAGDTNHSDDIFVHDRQTGTTDRVSVSSAGQQGNYGDSWGPSLSADGRFVAFGSYASNLVAGDTNGAGDIFVHDRQTGTTTRVSVSSAGEGGNDQSEDPSLSADGRFVAFNSGASNLVAGDTNDAWDIFVHDRQTGTTSRVSVSSAGEEGNNGSGDPSLSADGRFVAFTSYASNLVAGDTNGTHDIYVHDRQTGTTIHVSVSSTGQQGNGGSWVPSLSADGRFVAFYSSASNLVAGDTNGTHDIFVHDRQTGTTTRVSVSSAGQEGNGGSYDPSLSADGRFVAFQSGASNLIAGDTNDLSDIFVHDRQTDTTTRVSVSSAGQQGTDYGDSRSPSLSADGRFVAFHSYASNLVAGDTNGAGDIFVHDRQAGTTSRVSVSSAGEQGNNGAGYPSLSADGRVVAFDSFASNLVAGDTNDAWDIFVHERDGVAGAPTVTGFSPTSGPVGTSVTIDGTNFIGATAVTFNGTNQPAFTVVSATQITAAVPAGATTGPIAVTTTTGTATSAADFIVTVVPAKAIFLPAITADGR